MRRFLFGVVIASVTAVMPQGAFGGDREIAQSVMAELQQHKAAGNLKGFDIDLKVEDGVVYLTGEVANRAQRAIVEQAAINQVGQSKLVNEIKIKEVREIRETKVPAQPSIAQAARPIQIMPVSGTSESPATSPSDVAITDGVIAKLQQAKASGAIRGFDLDVSTIQGDVWLTGTVADSAQKNHVLSMARHVHGVSRVIDDIVVVGNGPVRQVSTEAPAPLPQASSMPVANNPVANPMPIPSPMPVTNPQPFAPSGLAGYVSESGEYAGGGYAHSGPVPMQMAGMQYGAGAPRYDQPNMPSYAWPSYAAHPNYAAVTYPKQYSPSAWPYIGPFYPYPQVPLGWRKVALEWDDGLWYLDFTSK